MVQNFIHQQYDLRFRTLLSEKETEERGHELCELDVCMSRLVCGGKMRGNARQVSTEIVELIPWNLPGSDLNNSDPWQANG